MNKRLIVETKTSRNCLRIEDEDGSNDYAVWLGLERDSNPEFVIGIGMTEREALADAAELLQKLADSVRGRLFPEDWTDV